MEMSTKLRGLQTSAPTMNPARVQDPGTRHTSTQPTPNAALVSRSRNTAGQSSSRLPSPRRAPPPPRGTLPLVLFSPAHCVRPPLAGPAWGPDSGTCHAWKSDSRNQPQLLPILLP